MNCKDCNKRESKIDYFDSFTSYTHGFVEKICRHCYIKRLRNTIKTCREQIKIQKLEIIKENETKIKEKK